MGLIRSSSLKASMKGAVLILAFGTLSFTNGFKLNALQKEVDEHAHHHHDHEEIIEEAADTRNNSEEARSSDDRAVAFSFDDDITPIIVDSAPPGVNFTECVVDLQTGNCCIDFVGEIRSAVTNPVLECITRNQKVCHTSYVTKFSSRREQECEENFEKKCHIVIAEVVSNETVRSCMKPLQRVCDNGDEQIVQRIKRDTSTQLMTIADILDETLENPRSMLAGRSIENFEPSNAEEECKIYFETICTNPNEQFGISTNNECERVPVRLCAEGCKIQEGPMTCKDISLSLVREVPREECEIVPQKTCKTVTKLYPELIPQEDCETTPKEICQLKFSPNPDLPTIQPLIQRYCLRGSIETNLVEENPIEEENSNEDRSFPDDVTIISKKTKENVRNNLKEKYQNIDSTSNKGPQARKLDIKQSDLNQVPEYYQKELEYEQAIISKPSNEDKNEETIDVTTENSIPDAEDKKDQTTYAPILLINEGSDNEILTESIEAVTEIVHVDDYDQTTELPLQNGDSVYQDEQVSTNQVDNEGNEIDIDNNEESDNINVEDQTLYEDDITTNFPIIVIDEEFEDHTKSSSTDNANTLIEMVDNDLEGSASDSVVITDDDDYEETNQKEIKDDIINTTFESAFKSTESSVHEEEIKDDFDTTTKGQDQGFFYTEELILVSTELPSEVATNEHIFEEEGSGTDNKDESNVTANINEDVLLTEVESSGEEYETKVVTESTSEQETELVGENNVTPVFETFPPEKTALPRKIEDTNFKNEIIYNEEDKIRSTSFYDVTEETTTFIPKTLNYENNIETELINDLPVKSFVTTISSVDNTKETIQLSTDTIEKEPLKSKGEYTTTSYVTTKSDDLYKSINDGKEENLFTTEELYEATTIQTAKLSDSIIPNMNDSEEVLFSEKSNIDDTEITTEFTISASTKSSEIIVDVPADKSKANEEIENDITTELPEQITTTSPNVSTKPSSQQPTEEIIETTNPGLKDYERSQATETTIPNYVYTKSFSTYHPTTQRTFDETTSVIVKETTQTFENIESEKSTEVPEATTDKPYSVEIKASPLKEYKSPISSPIHGCNETESDAEIVTEASTEQYEPNPTYSYFTEETTDKEFLESESSAVPQKSFEDIQPKSLNYDAKANQIRQSDKQEEKIKLVLDDKLTRLELETTTTIQPTIRISTTGSTTTETTKIPSTQTTTTQTTTTTTTTTTTKTKTTTTKTTTTTTTQTSTTQTTTTQTPTTQTTTITQASTTPTTTQITTQTTTTTTKQTKYPTSMKTQTTETEPGIGIDEEIMAATNPSTKISHFTSLLEETTRSNEKQFSSTNPSTIESIITDSPFIVFPEENEISNEIPTFEEYSKQEKESERSTTVSYSIVRPVATYHIVPVKKSLRA